MVSLKKASFLLALLTAVVLSSGTAIAQPTLTTCTATAVPPVVRAEGIAELVGDIVLQCTGGDAGGAASFQTNVSVSLNVNITNDEDEDGAVDDMDNVLIINENNATGGFDYNPANFSCDGFAAGDGGTNPEAGLNQCPQNGTQASNTRIEFNGVVFPNPALAADGLTELRISSIRANAAQLGVPDAATFPSTQITAFVSITGPTTIPVTNNVLNVAVPIVGLIVGFDEDDDLITGLQCVDNGDDNDDGDDPEGTSLIELNEGFATAFKTLGTATFNTTQTQWEAGYYSPVEGDAALGGATQGTRFIIRFFNIPEGVRVYVNEYINDGNLVCTGIGPGCGDGLELALVSSAASDGDGGTFSSSTSTTDLEEVDISGGFGYAVYEVVDNNPFVTEDIDVPIIVEWESDTENEVPGTGTAQVTADFAPLSTVFTASEGEPEPRFIETDEGDRTFLNIVKCTSTILFPFVTNQAGFDTGIAISNTSLDWLGTIPQSGACTIHYHGSTTGGGALADDEQTSTVLAGGEQLIFTLSGGNPGQGIAGAPEFQGYIIAVCDFQYGHGYAFITDGFGGIPALAQGYLALILELNDSGIGSRGLTGGIESLSH